MGKKILAPCLDVITIVFFQFSIRNMVFHCIFLGKKVIIITSKHSTRIFFPSTILFYVLMNSFIIFSNYYNLQSVHFEYNLHFEQTQLTPETSNLPLTRSNFYFPSGHLYIILPSMTRNMFQVPLVNQLYFIQVKRQRVFSYGCLP